MLYHLLPQLADLHSIFNVFRYITFRAAGAVVTALLIAFLAGPPTIRWLTRLRVGQVVRDFGPDHEHKAGTPTMGGVIMILSAAGSTLLWADLSNPYTLWALGALLWMGAMGFLDDWLKVVEHNSDGLAGRYKLLGQLGFGLVLGTVLVMWPIAPHDPTITSVPFFSAYASDFWRPTFVLFVAVVVAGTSNTVNLADGLDGLAAGLTAIVCATFGILAYLAGRVDTSAYLGLFYLPGAGEMAIFAVGLAGAAIGFLWYNTHPAEVFMGDTGSLSIGGAIGVMAILLKMEFLLVIVGGVFVLEGISVIAQTLYFKYSVRKHGEGRRLLRMSPIHHHFEKLGWAETKVVVRFWILGIFCAMIALSTLKIR